MPEKPAPSASPRQDHLRSWLRRFCLPELGSRSTLWGFRVWMTALGLLAGCCLWQEPWSGKKLHTFWPPLQAQKEAQEFKAKVQNDPFPDASVLKQLSARALTNQGRGPSH